MKAAAAVPEIKIANCEYNVDRMLDQVKEAAINGARLVVFPELSITGYTCGDLFHQEVLLKAAQKELWRLVQETCHLNILIVAGIQVAADNQLFNCAVALQKGVILGAVPKTYVPGYSEFYEERWFASANRAISDSISICGQRVPFGTDLLFAAVDFPEITIGIEICEDLWTPVPPSSLQAMGGATVLLNLSASNETIGKHEYRKGLILQQSGRCMAAYVYASSGIHESTTDVVFGGYAMISENGSLLAESIRFDPEGHITYGEIDVERLQRERSKNTSFMEYNGIKSFRRIDFHLGESHPTEFGRFIDPHPFVPSDPMTRDGRCKEIFSIQTSALGKRLGHTGAACAVIGISGGLDSTLALLVTAKTFDELGISREKIIGVTMPGFGTTDITYTNAIQLMKSMGVSIREVDIKPSCLQHFRDIGHDPAVFDVTYENVQARERTQVLMDLANKLGGLVIGTGDLSELALGWCTYNGDHMSMYSVNCGIPKTLVKFLVKWVSLNVVEESTGHILQSILDTPISPELLPPDGEGRIHQKTEDIVGPYELHDFFLYHALRYGAGPEKILFLAGRSYAGRYDEATLKKWLAVFYRRFFSQQFKRSCLPDGPKVGTISLSPRGDWRMPSDADARQWLKALQE